MVKILKTTLVAWFITFGFLLSGCSHHSIKPGWAETIATITESAQMPDGSYAYTITFYADKSTAVNQQGEPIKGPIEQHYFQQTKLAIEGQKLKMRYDIEEPIFNVLLEDIEFVE